MVYLLHFAEKYKNVQHYLGYTTDLEKRMKRHKNGHGARLVKQVTEAGIEWEVARVWEDGDKKLERKLKKGHNSPKLCPICKREHK